MIPNALVEVYLSARYVIIHNHRIIQRKFARVINYYILFILKENKIRKIFDENR